MTLVQRKEWWLRTWKSGHKTTCRMIENGIARDYCMETYRAFVRWTDKGKSSEQDKLIPALMAARAEIDAPLKEKGLIVVPVKWFRQGVFMQKSSEQDKLIPALMAARAEIDAPLKEKVARVTSEKGASYSYQYAGSHEFVLMAQPVLIKNGLILTFDPEPVAGELKEVRPATATSDAEWREVNRKVNMTALLEHGASNQWRSIDILVQFTKSAPGMNEYQALGALVTYCSGILTRCMLGMAADDAPEGGREEDGDKKGGAAAQRARDANAGRPAIQSPQESGKNNTVAPDPVFAKGEETKVALDCLDSYEGAVQMLDEKVEIKTAKGTKQVPIFLDDERKIYTEKLGVAGHDLSAMTLLYAEILNSANDRRAKYEGGTK